MMLDPRPEALLGRQRSLAATSDYVSRVADVGDALLVVGEAGVGKTALLDAAQDQAERAGLDVIRMRGGEFEMTTSLGVLRQLLSALRTRLPSLVTSHRVLLSSALREGGDEVPGIVAGRGELGPAVLALLRASAAETPLLLVVDDVQWLDPASAEALAFVARRLAGSHVGLLAAARPGSFGALEEAGLSEHRLEPLDEADARALLDRRFPQLSEPTRSRVMRDAAGIPLALLELPLAEGTTGHERTQTGGPSTPGLLGLFGPRVRALPPLTRWILLLAVLEGTGELAALVDQAGGEDILATLVPAEHNGLIAVDHDTGRLAIRHPLVGTTAVQLAEPSDLRRAHARLAASLADHPDRRVWHLAAAAAGPDEEVALLLEQQAAGCLRHGDVIGAAQLLERAAELSPRSRSRARRQVQAAFIRADVTGDLAGAARLITDADMVEPTLTKSLPATLAATYLLLNAECDVDTAHRLLSEAITAHPGRHDREDPVLEEGLESLAMMSWFGGRPALWEPFEEAVDGILGGAPALVDLVHRAFGDPVHRGRDALPALAEALRHVDTERDPLKITRIGLACVYTDRMGDCRQALKRVVDSGRDGGAVALAINALISGCVDDWLTGRWDEAVEHAAEGVSLSERHGYRRYSVILGGYIDQLVRVVRGDVDESRVAAEEMTAWATARGARITELFAEHLHTLRAQALGDYESAYRHAARISRPGELAPYNPHALWVLFDLVEAAERTDRHADAAAHVRAMREHHLEELSPRLRMVVNGCAALTCSGSEATALFEEALTGADSGRWVFDRARIQLAYGDHLHRASDPAAGPVLSEAAAAFRQLGARPWQTRATALLRASGTSVAGTGVGLTSLSARERHIADLAAQGLSNRQIGEILFLSPRSVGAALYRIFPKLGIVSRAELAAAVTAADDPDGARRPVVDPDAP